MATGHGRQETVILLARNAFDKKQPGHKLLLARDVERKVAPPYS
jgi:hypothetical protein